MARPSSPPETIERALTAVAISGSSYKAAEKTGTPARTIREWAQKNPERLEAIKRERAPLIDQACVAHFRDIVLNASQATLKAAELEHERINTGEVRDAAASARNLATTAAIATDKIALMEGRPTAIVEHRNPDEVLKRLQAKGLVIDSTATELDGDEADSPSAFLPESALPNAPELAS